MSDTVLQYRTNNDGTIGDLLSGRAQLPSGIQQQLQAAITAAEGDSDAQTTAATAIAEVLASQEDRVFLSRGGTYYKGKVAKYFGDSVLVSPSDALVGMLDTYGEIGIDRAQDLIQHAANAMGITYDPLRRIEVEREDMQASQAEVDARIT